MRATIRRLVCRHRYERRAVVIDRNGATGSDAVTDSDGVAGSNGVAGPRGATDRNGAAGPDEVVERCPKCGKERFRAPAGS
ncbi:MULTISPECIES: hypothetical protein [Halorubrum]|uniref:Uncharacterized protein n=1 Tax=Halorubrum hochstenium ATCC 700873 TaxID=1227481 RepID=M0FB25_9EURY|nr:MULTISPECIES: hypothetical protein [Halorubrum]ELZ57145.1 hypothetical protein C467_06970 [Halorubrum hochstenium ATCC 700873]